MDINNNILVQDTNGELAEDILKIDLDEQALSVWFSTDSGKENELNFRASNVDYSAIPGIQGSSYKAFLTYNGTSGYMGKMFSTVVAEDTGIFNLYEIPTLKYDFKNSADIVPIDGDISNIVIDIKMYNGSIDVLNYTDMAMGRGILDKGSHSRNVNSRRSFPTRVDYLPNDSCNRTFLDGWYTYTLIIFRDIENIGNVVAGNFYSKEGTIVRAKASGRYYDATRTIIDSFGNEIKDSIEKVDVASYEDILFSLNETSGISPQANSVFLHSQVLITKEIDEAMIQEVISAACGNITGCDLMDWQKLSLKKIAASVMFTNGLFEKAQILLESVREMCNGLGVNFNSNC